MKTVTMIMMMMRSSNCDTRFPHNGDNIPACGDWIKWVSLLNTAIVTIVTLQCGLNGSLNTAVHCSTIVTTIGQIVAHKSHSAMWVNL